MTELNIHLKNKKSIVQPAEVSEITGCPTPLSRCHVYRTRSNILELVSSYLISQQASSAHSKRIEIDTRKVF